VSISRAPRSSSLQEVLGAVATVEGLAGFGTAAALVG
jgi:hypothetical protein